MRHMRQLYACHMLLLLPRYSSCAMPLFAAHIITLREAPGLLSLRARDVAARQ